MLCLIKSQKKSEKIMNEFEIINNYFRKLATSKASLNLNDDIFFDKKNKLAVSTDTYFEKTHFLNFKKPGQVIKKIIRSSISDLICKGVYPKYIFICASGNKHNFTKNNLAKISNSIKSEQNKFKISIGGGDTVKSNKLSFSITSIGYASTIVHRNKAKKNDDIYVTGNLGDSFTGLSILKNIIRTNSRLEKYFIDKYFSPELHIKFIKKLKEVASSSIDISDGLFADLKKLINKQKLSYKIYLNKIPISKQLLKLILNKKFKKIKFISNGDDYQILFTAPKFNQKKIRDFSLKNKIRITKIGIMTDNKHKSIILDGAGRRISLKNKGYFHTF